MHVHETLHEEIAHGLEVRYSSVKAHQMCVRERHRMCSRIYHGNPLLILGLSRRRDSHGRLLLSRGERIHTSMQRRDVLRTR